MTSSLSALVGTKALMSIASEPFWGLGKGGLITIIIVVVFLIAVVVWLIRGTQRHD
ncbi:MAG: hypothetical protein J7J88_02520 [Dehalococcoidia bacterium]|nr:hypothetical protein [Dehalococcoidia bacterium]